jgi:NAD(P)-dependent dehydrogenase (short-subunit alcohol dehydrogenase family)
MNKKTVLITGSSTGFGHASAKLFADKGWNVVATMRDVSVGGDLAGRDNVFVTRLDVTDPASIDQAIKTSIERLGYSKRSPKKISKVTLTLICSG